MASSGVKGVYWHKKTKKWVARIQVHGVVLWLGYYDSFADAVAARRAAETNPPEVDTLAGEANLRKRRKAAAAWYKAHASEFLKGGRRYDAERKRQENRKAYLRRKARQSVRD